MNWMDIKTSLYKCQADNYGTQALLGDIVLSQFIIPHEWFYKDYSTDRWVKGFVVDYDSINDLRCMDRMATDFESRKQIIKSTLQCWTPSACLECKKKDEVKELYRTGLIQLDFDKLKGVDIEAFKRRLFDYSFVGLCSLSCSGDGVYALAAIAEAEKMELYAEHFFAVFEEWKVSIDPSKGKKPESLRYMSCDGNKLLKEKPKPLKLDKFRTRPTKVGSSTPSNITYNQANSDDLISWAINQIKNATTGGRYAAVSKVAYTLGGTGNKDLVNLIVHEIEHNTEFAGMENKYNTIAEECFQAGLLNPLPQKL